MIVRTSGSLNNKRMADLSVGVKPNSAEVYISIPTSPHHLTVYFVVYWYAVISPSTQQEFCMTVVKGHGVNMYGCLITQSEHM